MYKKVHLQRDGEARESWRVKTHIHTRNRQRERERERKQKIKHKDNKYFQRVRSSLLLCSPTDYVVWKLHFLAVGGGGEVFRSVA